MDGYDSERPNDGTDDDGTDGTDDANDANDATDVNNLNAFRVFFSHSRPKTTRRNATIVRAEGEAAAVREIRSIRAPLGFLEISIDRERRDARARKLLTRLNEIKFVPND